MINIINNDIISTEYVVPIVLQPETRVFSLVSEITDVERIVALDTLVSGLKSEGIWQKMYAIYPFVGGTSANNHRYNLINPLNTDAAYRLTFSGSWNYDNLGINTATASASNFANTFFNPTSSSSVSQNDVHISLYLRSALANTTAIMGATTASPGAGSTALQIVRTGGGVTIVTVNGGNSSDLISLGSAVSGYIIGNRTSSNLANGWLNGVKINSNGTTSLTPPNFNLILGGRNNGGTTSAPSNRQISFVSIGMGLTDYEATVFSQLVRQYQINLNRAVI